MPSILEALHEVERGLKKMELIPITLAAKEVSKLTGLSVTTVRKEINEQVAQGTAVHLKPNHRRVILPGANKPSDRVAYIQGQPNRVARGFLLTRLKFEGGWGLGQTTFLLSKERCAQLVGILATQVAKEEEEKRQRWAVQAAEHKAEQAVRDAERETEFTEVFPSMAEAFGMLRSRLSPEAKTRVVGMISSDGKRRRGSVQVEITQDDFPMFEQALRKAFGPDSESTEVHHRDREGYPISLRAHGALEALAEHEAVVKHHTP